MTILGIGTDIVECLKIAQLIERHGESFLRRVFTPNEVQHCSGHAMSNQLYASFWSAKEATLRALGTTFTDDMSWKDIEICPASSIPGEVSGRMRVRLGGKIRDICANLRVAEIMLTTSHCHTHAIAYAIAIAAEEEQ